jgi:hypothetical protein
MTILLVFSFAMYMSHGTVPRAHCIQMSHPQGGSSLMTVAHATTGSHEIPAAVPLFIPEKGQSPDVHMQRERIIMRETMLFSTDTATLSAGHTARLREIAVMQGHNPGSSIIVSIARPRPGSLAPQRLDMILDHLVNACAISRHSMYIQHAPDNSRTAGGLSEHAVDIRLTKSFWWF